MTKEEFEERFFEVVSPYIDSYNNSVILSWGGTHVVPQDFMEHLPETIRSQIKTWLANIKNS